MGRDEAVTTLRSLVGPHELTGVDRKGYHEAEAISFVLDGTTFRISTTVIGAASNRS